MSVSHSAFHCACCGRPTLSASSHDTYEICSECGWEDDPAQFANPDLEGGANSKSLNQAQADFRRQLHDTNRGPSSETMFMKRFPSKRRFMYMLCFFWSAFILGAFQSDTFGFHLDDLEPTAVIWLFCGWPAQLVIGILTEGNSATKLRAAAVSLVASFVFVCVYLKIDEEVFRLQHQANWLESNWRERWWPYPSILVYEEVEDGWYIYYAT